MAHDWLIENRNAPVTRGHPGHDQVGLVRTRPWHRDLLRSSDVFKVATDFPVGKWGQTGIITEPISKPLVPCPPTMPRVIKRRFGPEPKFSLAGIHSSPVRKRRHWSPGAIQGADP